ncbi:MAG: pyruvate, phosphate dikinase, partial [Deltaproteobacteria bacterium]|nr:pyruvate, phosphate dikinase [Deltaproteobacteria bacterium]
SYRDETFFLFVKSFYQLSGLGKGLSQLLPPNADVNGITALLIKYYGHTYRYWLDQADPLELFQDETMAALKANELDETLRIISHKGLHGYQEELEDIVQFSERDPESALIRLVALPGFGRIVAIYKDIPHRLLPSRDEKGKLHEWRLIFLLHVMDISGLSSIHEETLREINRTLGWLIEHQGPHAVRRSLEKTFAILERSAKKFPGTALHCVLNMGRGVYRTDESDLVDFFIDSLVSMGFQPPKLKGVGDDWQVRVNPGHIQNIRTWLQLIELKPMWSKKLLSSLIIHLSLSGVFIRDTDLFPREITRLLNSDISPVFNLTKQLTRLFPAYFNSIGAEGRLRDVSTHIDELCSRKDVLIHFLRKQSHVESSNQIVGLIEAALNFWKTKAKEGVRPFVPPGIYREIEREGPYIDGVHGVITQLFRKNDLKDIQDLLQVDEDNMHTFVGHVPGASDIDFERVGLAISFYKLLHQKYRLGFTEIEAYLSGFQSSGLPDLDGLRNILAKKDTGQKLSGLLDYLDQLKGIVLSSEDFEIREDIYRKRHFAADIPSMYGSYHEMKFDALGLMFRLESLAHVLFEELIDAIDLNLITRATFFQIRDNLRLFNRALHLDGITSLEMERQLDLLTRSLKIRGFTSTQYLDIFRGFSRALGNIVNDFFNNTHQENLLKISKQVQREDFLPKYLLPAGDGDREKLAHRVTEIFLRDQISSSFGLQQLDLFLTRILNTMNRQAKELHGERLHLLLSYDPQ